MFTNRFPVNEMTAEEQAALELHEAQECTAAEIAMDEAGAEIAAALGVEGLKGLHQWLDEVDGRREIEAAAEEAAGDRLELNLDGELLDLFIAQQDAAHHKGWKVFKLTCKGYPTTYEAARDGAAAYRGAIARKWARDGGEVITEEMDVEVNVEEVETKTQAA